MAERPVFADSKCVMSKPSYKICAGRNATKIQSTNQNITTVHFATELG